MPLPKNPQELQAFLKILDQEEQELIDAREKESKLQGFIDIRAARLEEMREALEEAKRKLNIEIQATADKQLTIDELREAAQTAFGKPFKDPQWTTTEPSTFQDTPYSTQKNSNEQDFPKSTQQKTWTPQEDS